MVWVTLTPLGGSLWLYAIGALVLISNNRMRARGLATSRCASSGTERGDGRAGGDHRVAVAGMEPAQPFAFGNARDGARAGS
jgi:hypothetical protein